MQNNNDNTEQQDKLLIEKARKSLAETLQITKERLEKDPNDTLAKDAQIYLNRAVYRHLNESSLDGYKHYLIKSYVKDVEDAYNLPDPTEEQKACFEKLSEKMKNRIKIVDPDPKVYLASLATEIRNDLPEELERDKKAASEFLAQAQAKDQGMSR